MPQRDRRHPHADPADASPGAESATRKPGGEVVEDTGGTGGEDRRYQPPVAGLLRAATADLHQPPPALHYRGRTHHAGRPYHRRAPHQRGGLPYLGQRPAALFGGNSRTDKTSRQASTEFVSLGGMFSFRLQERCRIGHYFQGRYT